MHINNIYLVILVIIVAGCSKENNSKIEVITSLPISTGTHWYYAIEEEIIEYASETSSLIVNKEMSYTDYEVWIDTNTLLNDSINALVFKSYEENDASIYVEYKYIDSEGLKTYATETLPYSIDENIKIAKTKKITSHSSLFTRSTKATKSISVKDRPLLDIILPLNDSSNWTYQYPKVDDGWSIDKEVIGTTSLNINGIFYYCYIVEWYYRNTDTFTGVYTKEWISKEGIIKKQLILDRTEIDLGFGIIIDKKKYKITTITTLERIEYK